MSHISPTSPAVSCSASSRRTARCPLPGTLPGTSAPSAPTSGPRCAASGVTTLCTVHFADYCTQAGWPAGRLPVLDPGHGCQPVLQQPAGIRPPEPPVLGRGVRAGSLPLLPGLEAAPAPGQGGRGRHSAPLGGQVLPYQGKEGAETCVDMMIIC